MNIPISGYFAFELCCILLKKSSGTLDTYILNLKFIAYGLIFLKWKDACEKLALESHFVLYLIRDYFF